MSFYSFIITTFLIFQFSAYAQEENWKNQIIEDAKKIYTTEALKEFKKPIIFKIVSDQSVSASAHHNENELAIHLNQGLLASPRLSPDSLRMIICHELGHLFGGAPRKNVPPEWEGPQGSDGRSLYSSEGQADYYASLVCFKKMLQKEKTKTRPDLKRVGPVLKAKCRLLGHNEDALNDCYRSALAGLDFLNLVVDFPISCEKSDPSLADKLIRDYYPERQCRLDTIINGALCPENFSLSLNPYQSETNSCLNDFALRPACWFKIE